MEVTFTHNHPDEVRTRSNAAQENALAWLLPLLK